LAISAIFDPSGFINFTVFSYMPVVLGIFAIQAGGGLLAGDEEKALLDLVLAHLVSRTPSSWAGWQPYRRHAGHPVHLLAGPGAPVAAEQPGGGAGELLPF
jgi:hypothetical protein